MKRTFFRSMSIFLVFLCASISVAWAQCDPVVVNDSTPYFESFEDSTFGCWTQEYVSGTANWAFNTNTVQDGYQSVKFGGSSGSSQTMLVSPVLDLTGINSVPKLTFYHQQATSLISCCELHVYYRANANEAWTLLRSYTTECASFTKDSVFLPDASSTYQIAFKGVDKTLNFTGVYLDNIRIEDGNVCMAPEGVASSTVTSTEADLYWTALGNSTEWEISYGANGVFHTETATNTSFHLTGLTPSTDYIAFVRTICSATESSDWSDTCFFRTTCLPQTITTADPYMEDFSSYNGVGSLAAGVMPDCWNHVYSGTTASHAPKVFNGTTTPNPSDNALAISAGSSSILGFITLVNAGHENFVFMPEFTNPLDELQLFFSTAMSSDTAGTLTLGYIINTDDLSTFTPIDEIASNDYATNRRVDHIYDFGAYPELAGMTARLAFRWTDTSTTASSTACIDDVMLRIKLDCAEPNSVSVANVTDATAEISWTAGDNSQTEWEISYNNSTILATTNPFTLTGLTPVTEYTVNVRAICGADDTSYWSMAPVSFTTACEAILVDDDNPFEESFNTANLGCWSTEVITATDDWTFSSAAAHTGAYGITYSSSMFGGMEDMEDITDFFEQIGNMTNFGTGSARLVSPAMDITGVTGPVQLSFYRKQTSMMIPQYLYVYYRTSATGTWTYLQQYTNVTNNWVRETVILPSPTATYQIAFLSYVDIESIGDEIANMGQNLDPEQLASTISIDDIRIGYSADCITPSNISITNVAETSFTATWDAGNASSWNIEYGPAGFTHGNGTTVTANNNTYTFTGLTPNTSYDIYVQANCGGENISDWAPAYTVSTLPSGIANYNELAAKVYPNPTTGNIRIELAEELSCSTQATVYDVFGKQLISEQLTGNNFNMDLSSLASGVYTLRIVNAEGLNSTIKIVKK